MAAGTSTVRYLAIATPVTGAVLTLIGFLLVALTPAESTPTGFRLGELLGYLVLQGAMSGVGALLTWRRPENLIGWLLSFGGVLSGFEFVTAGYAIYGQNSGALPDPSIAAWLYSVAGTGFTVVIGLVLVTFPDGHARTGAGRAARALVLVGVATLALAIALLPGPLTRFPTFGNPFGWTEHADVVAILFVAGVSGSGAALALALKQLFDRARQATAIERQQFKWFLSGTSVLGLWALIALPQFLGPARSDGAATYFLNLIGALATAALPITIGIAILRYHLYDIDLLIKRTVVYTVTSAAIAGAFLLGIVATQTLLRSLTGGSELAIAASTLVSLALFQPIRRLVQSSVDRRFDRSRYDAARTLDAFGTRLGDHVNLDALRGDLLAAVCATMAPAQVSLWLRDRPRGGPAPGPAFAGSVRASDEE